MEKLVRVIDVDEEKCVNCHRCINVCYVKYCNDGIGDFVDVDPNTCIGCGRCLEECPHDARQFIDDFDSFMADVKIEDDLIAIVAPSIVANFPGNYLRINSWLKELGVKAVFDVSFGAELTVKSYLEHIKRNDPKSVIAQPCPAIVSYIELYKPELLEFLAPADSPMVHIMKMIKEYYPAEYGDSKIAVLSPCLAKKREFEATGIGDYNVTFKSLENYFEEEEIALEDYAEEEYDNPEAERAVLFSSPGGLMETAARELPQIVKKVRKIEGPEVIYHYIDHFTESLEKDVPPLLVDCLNCELGCNGGTGTINQKSNPDVLETAVRKRSKKMKDYYRSQEEEGAAEKKLENILDKYWKLGLYDREYKDLSDNIELDYPSQSELEDIYQEMGKFDEAELYNCSSCGYDTCEEMAVAIYNGLNKKENCHFFLVDVFLQFKTLLGK